MPVPTSTTTLELLVPDAHHSRTRIPITSAQLNDDWPYGDGHVLWTIAGVRILDGSFDLYPPEQLEAVVSTLTHVVSNNDAVVNVPGSILNIAVRSIDRHAVEISLRCTPTHKRQLSALDLPPAVKAPRAALVRDTLRDVDAVLTAPAFFIPSPRPTLGSPPLPRFPELFESVHALRTAARYLLTSHPHP